jgi:large subunit ribosomal protein L15
MKLNESPTTKAPRKKRMRVGRGIGSGKGKTGGRGGKGQKARSGVRHQRLRRRPDAAAHAPAEARLQQHQRREYYAEVNLGRMQQAIDAASSTPRRRSTPRRWSRPA